MERTINFIQVVYEYYKNEPPYSDFTLEELLEKEILTGKKAASVPVTEFEQARQDFTKDFRDIVRIFCIEDFIEDFKINGEYQFTFADRDFHVTLVNHYRTKQAWIKALKKRLIIRLISVISKISTSNIFANSSIRMNSLPN